MFIHEKVTKNVNIIFCVIDRTLFIKFIMMIYTNKNELL